jgi:hypothetical protein
MNDNIWTTDIADEIDNEIVRVIQERTRMREESELVELSGRIGSIADTTEIETINDDEARILHREQLRRRLEALQEAKSPNQERGAQVTDESSYRATQEGLRRSVEGWQERERQERDRMIRGEWPDSDQKWDFEKSFGQPGKKKEKEKILKPLPDELFEID